ncbi:MAG TPA: tetratricopeptide repeat protein [Gemmataceae bacterium]|nr:tetratricopeptide repeat protein [Gemmataceae bacterium]
MKYFGACLLALGLAFPALAEGPTLTQARQRWLHGNYQEARDLYLALAKQAGHKDEVAIGLSRTWQSQGKYDKALDVVDEALKGNRKSAALLARRAELLYLRGRWDAAVKAADRAVDLDTENLLARWVRAQVYRDRGDIDQAETELRWFIRTYVQRNEKDDDIKDPDQLLLVGLAGSENARWNKLPDQFSFILNEVYGDALKADKDFWPAEHQAGMLLLEKYNRGEALDALDKALAINAHAAEALVGKGTAALQQFEVRDAERLAERALKINPNLQEALNLRADVYLASGDAGKALKELEHAREVNPRDETTLGRVAACLYLLHKNGDFDTLASAVQRQDNKAGLVYYILADQLEQRRRYDDAEKYYKKSAALRPKLPWPHNNLGLLYMRLGREKEAHALLTKAFEADEFNVRVSNSLKVLRHLDKYATLKTAHFELRFDPQRDQQLANYMKTYLEEVYGKLADKFHYHPPGRILVEVFNNHEMFSGRTIALPDLHTIGASTGRMFAMVSPRGKGMAHPFNWARVLRHEMVHIFNLEQTHFQCPHWYTEGLAVSNEGFPRPQQWNELLLERVPAGKLMNLDDIDLGFIRPAGPDDWHMAYCQAQLYVSYMTEKYGAPTIGELLQAYSQGLDTRAAIAKVCHVDQEAFEKGYRTYLQAVVKTIKKKPAAKAMRLDELRDAHEQNPDDADVAARLALQYLRRGRATEARKLADGVLAKNKAHGLAAYVKAELLQKSGEDEQARKLLEAAVDPTAPEPRVVGLLGKLYFEGKDFRKAARMYELAHQAEPYESKWLTELAKVYVHSGDKDKQIKVLKELVPTDADDLDSRKRLARLLEDTGRHAEAEQYARQGLEIDVLDVGVQKVLGDALLGQKKFAAAIEAYRAALEIDDKADETRLKLAEAYLGHGDKQRAAAEVARVEAGDPDNAEAKRLRGLLNKSSK